MGSACTTSGPDVGDPGYSLHLLESLPKKFTKLELFERMAETSYGGEIRMLLSVENRNKVEKII